MSLSLADVTARAWRDKYDLSSSWHVNLASSQENISLGDIGHFDDDHWNKTRDLARIGIDPPTDPALVRRENTAWDFQSSRSFSFTLASKAAGSVPNVPFLGDAEVGLELKFGSEAGLAALGSAQWREQFDDIDGLRPQLVNAAKNGDIQIGRSVVVGLQRTGQGSVFVSEGNNSGVTITGNAQLLKSGFSPASLELGVGTSTKEGAVRHEGLPDGAAVAMRVLFLGKRGFLWWRRIVALGAVEGINADALQEIDAEDEDYWALV